MKILNPKLLSEVSAYIGSKISENSSCALLWRGLEYFCQYVQRKLSRVMKSFNFRIVAENVSYCHDIPRTCQIENKCYAKICCSGTDYRHTKAKSLILCCPNSNPNPK